MKNSPLMIAMFMVGASVGTGAQAQTAGNLLAAVPHAAGTALTGVAAGHAGIAPTVNAVSPTVEPLTDGVTNIVSAAAGGVYGAGDRLHNGVVVGQTASGKPLASVGASQPANQGSVVAALNGRP